MPLFVRLYSLLYTLLIPFLLIRFILRSRSNAGYRYRLLERFGWSDHLCQQRGVHFHLVSVGETLAAAPVIDQFMSQYPDLPITITSTTPTGSHEVEKRFSGKVHHVYLPFDVPGAMRRFFKKVKPRVVVLMETELWPNMLTQARHHGAKVIIINGRLSARSAKGYQGIAGTVKYMLGQIHKIACVDEGSYRRFKNLGAASQNLTITGNLKYDYKVPKRFMASAKTMRQQVGEKRLVWIAGSTHAGEDETLLKAHQSLLADYPDALLLIAPRHPERFNRVAEMMTQSGLKVARLSDSPDDLSDCSILVCDTLGQLQMLYGVADVCFVGGSLVDVGGHNPIEPIAMHRPVLSGPVYYNFEAVFKGLIEQDAVVIVSNAKELSECVSNLWQQNEQRKMMVAAADQEIVKHQGALRRTLDVLATSLD